MWLLLSRRLRRFVVLSVVIPLVPKVIQLLRRQLERRTGSTRATRSLAQVEAVAQRLARRSLGGTGR